MSAQKAADRVAVYARISQDDSKVGAGVTRQLQDTRQLADSRGWTVTHELLDNDVSAYSGAKRAGYLELMRLVDAREVDRIVVYQTSRLWRSRRERAADMERLREARVSVSAVRGPELDLATASGRMLAGILGEFDTAESEIKGERVARAAAARAAAGQANGAVLYGWRRTYELDDKGQRLGFTDVPEPSEAEVVGRIVKAVVAGETLAQIARDLTAEGVEPPRARENRPHRAPGNDDGTRWGPSSVRKLATRPANVGLRVAGGVVVSEAAWAPIVDKGLHEQAVAVLSVPGRRTSFTQHERRHLLTFGIGECGVCGFRLRVATRSGNPLYVCDSLRGCTGRRQEWVDGLVDRIVVEYLGTRGRLPMPTGNGAQIKAARAAERLRRKLADAAELFAADRITADQLDQITGTLRAQLSEAESESAPPLPVSDAVRKVVQSRDVEAAWAGADLLTRRDVLGVLGLRVRIMPTRPGPGFEPGDVEFTWGQA